MVPGPGPAQPARVRGEAGLPLQGVVHGRSAACRAAVDVGGAAVHARLHPVQPRAGLGARGVVAHCCRHFSHLVVSQLLRLSVLLWVLSMENWNLKGLKCLC